MYLHDKYDLFNYKYKYYKLYMLVYNMLTTGMISFTGPYSCMYIYIPVCCRVYRLYRVIDIAC